MQIQKTISILCCFLLLTGCSVNASRYTEKNVNSTLQNSIEEIDPSLPPVLVPEMITMETDKEIEHWSIKWEQNSQNTQELQAKTKLPSQKNVNQSPNISISWLQNIPTSSSEPQQSESTSQSNAKPSQSTTSIPNKTPIIESQTTANQLPSNTLKSEQMQVLDLVNQYRNQQGLASLSYRTDLQNAVDQRAQEITTSFSYTRPNEQQFYSVLTESGIRYQSVSENIAYGQHNASTVMTAWMNSQGHRQNILSSNYSGIAVGLYEKTTQNIGFKSLSVNLIKKWKHTLYKECVF